MLGFLSMSLWGWLQEFDTEGGGGGGGGGTNFTATFISSGQF